MGLLAKVLELVNEERCRVCGVRFRNSKRDPVCRGAHMIGFGHTFSDGWHGPELQAPPPSWYEDGV